MKKKLAIIVPSMRGGGAERVILNIVKNIDREKFLVRLILIKKEGPYLNFLPEDITIVDLNSARVRKSVFKLLKELNSFKPDIILSTLGHLNLVMLGIKPLLKFKTRIVIREANTPSTDIKSKSFIKSNLILLLSKFLYPKADLIIAQCKAMKQDIVDFLKVNEKKVCYIYNPLDVKAIRENADTDNPYDKTKINIVAVGRLTHQKGFDILLNAFKLVNEKIPETHLTILGEGPLEEKLNVDAQSMNIKDSVSIMSFKENPYPYYKYSDMYVLSSRWEGFPNTLLEALACNAKVIAADCKSGPQEILKNQTYGVLVKTEDYKSLYSGIMNYLNEESRTGSRAEAYDINKIIKDYENVLYELCS